MNRLDAAIAEGRPIHWTDLADCADRTRPTEDLAGVPTADRPAVARWYCSECVVTRECAANALDGRDAGVVRGGVWLQEAGTQTKHARQRLRRVAGQ